MIRHKLAICLASAALLASAPANSRQLDQNNPDDALKVLRKSICSLNDGETVIYWWTGSMFSRVEGEKDRKLFGLQGMNIRQCYTVKDAEKGEGFRSVSREIMIHTDPETGEIKDSWTNPWTGEELAVMHVANDPVNMRAPIFKTSANGTPLKTEYKIMGKRAIRTGNTPLFYKNPLQGDYQDWVGGSYHAMEMGNDFFYADDLLDSETPTVKHHSISWSRTSRWLPWMKMGDRNGLVYTATVGGRVSSVDDLPEPLRTVLKQRYPAYVAPPPIGDTRPNETSWEVFRKMMETKAKEAGQ